MKQNSNSFEIADEIDLSKMKRIPNPFTQQFHDLNLVSLDDDVKKAFPNSASVNSALRSLMAHKDQVSRADSDALPKAS